MRRVLRLGAIAGRFVLRGLWLSLLVLLPVFGMWLASSLAAYANATPWLALLIGLLLFPIVPGAWDLLFVWRMRRHPDRKRILTRVDRLVLRTLIVNLLFVGGLVWQRPATVYQALSVRGDWMLDGRDGPTAQWMRARMFTIADWFRRGWTPGDARHYGTSDEAPSQPPPPPPLPEPMPVDDPGLPDAPMVPDVAPVPDPDPKGWPMPATMDPVVTAMPADVQTTIASIGAYLAANIVDLRQRTKAVHDVVVLRLRYDDAALALISSDHGDQAPPMDAEAVFARRSGVCEGYARLMTALGTAAGLDIRYVTGFVRGKRAVEGADTKDDDIVGLSGNGHAWNAAQVDGYWYPIDATWDDSADGDYATTYLFTPPVVFLRDHFPRQPEWQLVAAPKSMADFLRQPALTAEFAALGLTLRLPERSQVSVSGAIDVVLDNPRRHNVMATVSPADVDIGDDDRDCGYAEAGPRPTLRCARLGDGEWRVDLWGAPRGTKSLSYLGSIWVNSR